MGARPVLATVALGVPAGDFAAPFERESWLVELYHGMVELSRKYRTTIAGGDIVRAPALTLSIAVVGEVSRTRMKRRDRGHAKDVVAVSGPLGASRAGLELLRHPSSSDLVPGDLAESARCAFAMPTPRIAEGRWFAASANVHAMMDCSDGLAIDLDRLARASGCGATIERVPVAREATEIARVSGDDPESYALEGGEDFELIVAIAPRAFTHVARRFELRFRRPLIAVGRLDSESGLRRVEEDGEVRAMLAGGWDHLQ